MCGLLMLESFMSFYASSALDVEAKKDEELRAPWSRASGGGSGSAGCGAELFMDRGIHSARAARGS